jgi:isoquinoline 1-oxidoreductase alpha subunit
VYKIRVNNTDHTVDVSDDMPLLWVLRDELGLVGTKYGCGIGSCGACKVFIDDEAVQSCSVKIRDVKGAITTIEGILNRFSEAQLVTESWINHQVAQCGYCQPGQIISVISLLRKHENPDDEIIEAEMAGNLCRCGTYPRIKEAINSVAKSLDPMGIADRKMDKTT